MSSRERPWASFSSSSDSTFDGMVRNAAAAPRMLVEGVDAEAREVRHREAEVAFEVFLVHLPLMVAHDVVHHGVHVLVLHRRQVDAPDVAVDADHRAAGRPTECRSEALFLTAKASSSVMSIYNPCSPVAAAALQQVIGRNSRASIERRISPTDYEPLREGVASCDGSDRPTRPSRQGGLPTP